MINNLKKILRNAAGYSLVEILVAVGVLAAGSLAVMKTMDMIGKQSEKDEVQVDFDQFLFSVDNYLGRKDVCEKQFLDMSVEPETEIPYLRDPTLEPPADASEGDQAAFYQEHAVFKSGESYLGGKIVIVSMKLVRIHDATAALRIAFKRKDSAKSPSTYQYVRDIPMVHELDATRKKMAKCYETDSGMFNLAERLCENNNGIYNPVTKTCHFRGFGESTTCPDGQVIRSITYDATNFSYKANCSSILDVTSCQGSWIKSISDNGEVVCLNLSDLIDLGTTPFITGVSQSCALKTTAANKIKFVCTGSSTPPADPVEAMCPNRPVGENCPTPAMVCSGQTQSGCQDSCQRACPSVTGTKFCTSPAQGFVCAPDTSSSTCGIVHRCHLNKHLIAECKVGGGYTLLSQASDGSCLGQEDMDLGMQCNAIPACN